ncbi:MAG: GNAT family N-acetyltransferase, partial [Aggregatilineales bacterium]
MMTALEIRPTVPETDYEAIAKIVSLVEREDVSVERLHNWDNRLMEDDILDQYTAWADGEIVGYCSAFRSVTAKIPKMNLIVIVHPSAEKQGYGSILYDTILRRAQHHQSTRLSAFVYEDRPHAVAFAENRGFEIRHHTFNSVLDVTSFDTAPYTQLIRDIEAQGVRFSSLIAEGNNDVTLRKLYALNKRVAEDEPTHDGSSEHSYQTWKSYIAGADWFYPAGQLVAIDGENFVGLGA